MEDVLCRVCQRPKASLECGLCQQPTCKKCAGFVKESTFLFLKTIPSDLSHRVYCGHCFTEKVEPSLEAYNQTLNAAKDVLLFYKNQGEETRNMSRSEKPLRVIDCTDRNETIMRLAFLAVEKGFNTLIDVEITFKKVRNEGYETSLWTGSAIPTRSKTPAPFGSKM